MRRLRRLGEAVVLAFMMIVVVAGITALVSMLHDAQTHSKPVIVIHPGSSNGRIRLLES